MIKVFLSLPDQARDDILNAKSRDSGLSATVLEKDVWICWLLKECLEKSFKLLPGEAGLKVLEDDFRRMVATGMFFVGEEPVFGSIIEDIKRLQNRLNNKQ